MPKTTRILTPVTLFLLPLYAQAPSSDRYPEIRAIIREAEAASAGVRLLDDRSNPHSWAGTLYARAGYLEDSARAFGVDLASRSPYPLWRAQVVYGDLAGAEKKLRANNPESEKQAGALSSLADLLWRMGKPAEARVRYEDALAIASKIANPEHRKRITDDIRRGLAFLSEEPPDLISPVPHPVRKFKPDDSAVPPFPITTGGFRDLDLKEVADRAAADARFMTDLYGRIAAGDREGIARVAAGAETPFRKALGFASLEHLMIQANQAEAAERFAEAIEDKDPDCALAKAEALSAAASAWLRRGETGRADRDFEAATALARSVGELPLGRVSVVVSIAAARFRGGMVASSAESFELAQALAEGMPLRPKPSAVPAAKPSRAIHYRDEAENLILLAAIRAHNLGAARKAADLWKADNSAADFVIVRARLNADQTGEALAFARKSSNPSNLIAQLLSIAQYMLDEAGAPNF
jgi:hypothetical protein